MIAFAEPVARRWVKRYFHRASKSNQLPRPVCSWLKTQPRSRGPKTLEVKRGAYRLRVHAGPRSAALIVLEMELVAERHRRSLRTRGDLTRRELEVLQWIAAGKSNAQVAEILRMAEATVGKHATRLYEKLGVESRTAAANLYRDG